MIPHRHFDVVVLGAGTIGLSIALALRDRGTQVLLLDRGRALAHASQAAAGMLAVFDPHNPATLLPLSKYSASLYPAFLDSIEALSGIAVPIQTERTLETFDDGHQELLHERSIDPRMLGHALLAAVQRQPSIELREQQELSFAGGSSRSGHALLVNGEHIHAQRLVLATGAWGVPEPLRSRLGLTQSNLVAPSKGQMLRVALPPSLAGLDTVHRRGPMYIVPRTRGPQAGTALLGATIEDAGFDTTVHSSDLASLRAQAAGLLPAFADPAGSPEIESWAGLRPATIDGLPLLGPLLREEYPPATLCALGAGRNGILLTPAIARILADLLDAKAPALDLAAFNAQRFAASARPALASS